MVSEASAKNQSLLAYTYDPNGSRSGLGLDGTPFASYGYDDASRLTSITRGASVLGFGYDTVNRDCWENAAIPKRGQYGAFSTVVLSRALPRERKYNRPRRQRP